MKKFRSLEEVEVAGLPPSHQRAVARVVQGVLDGYAPYGGYDPDISGPILYVEDGDDDAVQEEAGYPLIEALFEDVCLEDGIFVGVTLHSNEWGISWLIPDEPWLDPAVRAKLLAECNGRDER